MGGKEEICYVGEEDLSLFPCLYVPNINRFFHPLRNLFFESKTIAALPEGKILAQSYNWLLMVEHYQPPFFFNPSTNQTINLPQCPDNNLLFRSAAFSSTPTSLDCELVTFSETCVNGDNVVAVKTMKRGENGFHTRKIVGTLGCLSGCKTNVFRTRNIVETFGCLSDCKTVFHKGEYYCMGKEGNMMVYNPRENNHRLMSSPEKLWKYFFACDCSHYMFEGEGDLWVVLVARQGEEVCVLKLNWTDQIWEEVHNLEDRAVFVSRKFAFMEKSKVDGAGNKIYFPRLRGGNALFYCLAAKRYYNDLVGSIFSYDNFRGSEDMLRAIWMKIDTNPLSSQTCEKQLSW